MAERRVVDLDDRARVVAEVAEQAEVELHPSGDASLDQQVVGLLEALCRPLDGGSAQLSGLIENLRPAPQAGQAQQRLAAVGVQALDLVHGHLQADEVVLREPVEDPAPVLALHAELREQLPVEIGVAQPQYSAIEPDGVERSAQHLEHLGGPLRGRRAEQLDPGVQELADLRPLRADDPVGVADVTEAVGRLGVSEAARDEARDRDGHVGAQGEELAALVEEAVRAHPAAALSPLQDLVVLQGRRRDVAVAEALEHLDQGRLERAEFAHLVREDVPGSGWDRVDHRLMIASRSLTSCKVRGDRVVAGTQPSGKGGEEDGGSRDSGVRGDC